MCSTLPGFFTCNLFDKFKLVIKINWKLSVGATNKKCFSPDFSFSIQLEQNSRTNYLYKNHVAQNRWWNQIFFAGADPSFREMNKKVWYCIQNSWLNSAYQVMHSWTRAEFEHVKACRNIEKDEAKYSSKSSSYIITTNRLILALSSKFWPNACFRNCIRIGFTLD